MRVVMYVRNDLSAEARVMKEAASLVDAGHRVTVIGSLPPESPTSFDRETRDGIDVVRVRLPRWRGWWRWFRLPSRALDRVLRRPTTMDGLDWLAMWRFGNLGWAAAAADAAPEADIHHGHDLTGLPAAVRAARRDVTPVVYDSHELFLDSGAVRDRPHWAVSWLDRLERRLAREASVLITVNQALADRLGPRLGIERVVVVHNCPPRPAADAPIGDGRLRRAMGVDDDARVVVSHGGFRQDRGLEVLIEAVRRPELGDVHLALLGFGPLRERLVALAAEPASDGRIHVLESVPPEEVVAWIAGADIAAMPIQPRPLSYFLSTPNKLFESLAAGLPIVGSDFPGIRSIVVGDPEGPLGALCDPTDPASIAAAIRSILDRPPKARSDLRARARRAARERWNWETEAAKLVALYAELETAVAPGTADATLPADPE